MRCGIGDFGMGHRWEDAEEASVLRIEENALTSSVFRFR